jgi:hypothetical protein
MSQPVSRTAFELESAGAGAARFEAPEDCLHAGDEFAWLERFSHVVVRAQFEPGHPIDDIASRRQHNDRDIAGPADFPADLETVLAGEHHVEQQQVRIFPPQPAHAFRCVGSTDELDAEALEIRLQQLRVLPVVVDQENLGHAVDDSPVPGPL